MAFEVLSHAIITVFICYDMLIWLSFDDLGEADGLYSVCYRPEQGHYYVAIN